MNPIELLKEKLSEAYPFASTCIDRPKSPDGRYWLDFIADNCTFVIEWKNGDRIGVWLENEDTAKSFDTYEEAFEYIKSLKIKR